MILLQVQIQLPQHNPTAIVAVLIALAIATIFFVINSRRGAQRARPSGESQKFTRGRFRRAAHARGLNQVQTRTLENLALKYRPTAPMSVFASNQVLDIVLSKAISEVKTQTQSDSIKEAHINTIYRIKQTIEHSSGSGQSVQSTSQIRTGQEITITAQGSRYATRVTGRLRNVLTAEIPLDDTGNQVRWPKWTPVEVFFARSGGKGFAFQSKVVGYSTLKGVNSILLQHSNSVSAAAQRKYRRKELDRPAYFYAVQIMTVGTGRNAKRQAVPQTKGALGTMLDVSAGGCAVKTTFPLPKNSLIKLEFETDKRRQVTVYGKVKSVRKAEPMGGFMHIMFTRISGKNLNRINSYVYEIG